MLGILVEDNERITGRFRFTTPWLKPGNYRLDLHIVAGGMLVDIWEGACSLTISPVLPYMYSATADGVGLGLVFGDFVWETDESVKDGGAIRPGEELLTAK